MTVDPTVDFKPGEVVSVTAPALVQSRVGADARPFVYQFTAQAGAAPGTFAPGSDPIVGNLPTSVAMADVDGDGDLDLLSTNFGDNTVSVRLNNGTGSFSGTTDVGMGSDPYSVVAADVDGDGDLDMLAANDNTSGTVSVRLNNGTGAFGGITTVPVGTESLSVVAADVDGDGDLDILTANRTALGTVSVRLNNGTGTFFGTTEVAVGNFPYSVVAADVDGDGDLDILAANSTALGTVSVRFNNGQGTFSGTTNVPVGINPSSLTVADVDGDGDLDILTANNTTGAASGTVSVRLNDGLGTFSGTTEVSVGKQPQSLVVADVDGDGDLDILTANLFGGTVSIRLNNGTGTFSGTAEVAVFYNPIGVAVADVDGDGDLDILTADYNNTVSVRLNQLLATTWTGAVSGNWFGAGNWTGGVPASNTDALIPVVSSGRYPVIGAGLASVRTLTLAAGASLTQAGGTLSLTGSFINNGTFLTTGGTVFTSAGQRLGGSSLTRFYGLSVGPGGATLSGAATLSQVLTLSGDLDTGGNPFTLLSSPTGGDALVVNSGGVVVGAATVQRAIDPSLNPGLGYHHYSAPVSGSTVADLATSSFTPVVNPTYNTGPTPGLTTPFPTVYGYDQSRVTLINNLNGIDKGFFSPAALTDPLVVGRGYTVNVGASQLVDFVGTLNNGDLPLSLSRNSGAGAADGGWQLLGNPYPAPLDVALVAAADRPGLDAATYVFSSSGPYTGTYRTVVNGVGGGGVLPIGQAFFAHVSTGQTTASFTFRNSQRLTLPNAVTFQRPAETRPLAQLTLRNASGTLADEAYVYFQAGATAGVEADFDAVKLTNPSGLNLTAVAAGQELAINGLPLPGNIPLTVPLGVRVPATGTYTLSAAQLLNLAGTDVFLRDAQLGTLIDLHQQPTYSFTLSALSSAPRFELFFRAAQLLGTASAAGARPVALFPNPAHAAATLTGTASGQLVQVFDALGRRVASASADASGTAELALPAGLASGVYVVRVGPHALRLVVE